MASSFPIQMVQKWGMSEKYVGAAQLIVKMGELSEFAVKVRIRAFEPCGTYCVLTWYILVVHNTYQLLRE